MHIDLYESAKRPWRDLFREEERQAAGTEGGGRGGHETFLVYLDQGASEVVQTTLGLDFLLGGWVSQGAEETGRGW